MNQAYSPLFPSLHQKGKTRTLTGITTSGTPHLGNYVGAIRPALQVTPAQSDRFYFLADWHALIKQQDPKKVQQSTLEIAATWLACGLNPEEVCLYRQSSIPEISELNWLLTCVTSKGWLNRAHAFKAAVDDNEKQGRDPEEGITAGLYMYPVLMSADILCFGAHRVPVGKDQVQHVQIARDIAQRFNHLYGETLVLPEAMVDEHVSVLPGLDGRKMSKSYHNTIHLWSSEKELRQLIFSILTDSTPPGGFKDPSQTHLMPLFEAFSGPQEAVKYAEALRVGRSWGEAKEVLFEQINAHLKGYRSSYQEWMEHPEKVEGVLESGAHRARLVAQETLREAREKMGLRSLHSLVAPEKGGIGQGPEGEKKNTPTESEKFPVLEIKQFMEGGRAFVKLGVEGVVYVQSVGFESPQKAGQWIKGLQSRAEGLPISDASWLNLDDQVVASWCDHVDPIRWEAATRAWGQAAEEKQKKKNKKRKTKKEMLFA